MHKDTLHSGMNVVTRLCGRMEPQDTNLETCVKSLSTLLKHEDPYVSAKSLLSLFDYKLYCSQAYLIWATKNRTYCQCSGDNCTCK